VIATSSQPFLFRTIAFSVTPAAAASGRAVECLKPDSIA
jgi:hypothetical protein